MRTDNTKRLTLSWGKEQGEDKRSVEMKEVILTDSIGEVRTCPIEELGGEKMNSSEYTHRAL